MRAVRRAGSSADPVGASPHRHPSAGGKGGGLRDRGGRGWREGREAALLRGLPGRLPPPPPLLLLPAAGPLRGETLESH